MRTSLTLLVSATVLVSIASAAPSEDAKLVRQEIERAQMELDYQGQPKRVVDGGAAPAPNANNVNHGGNLNTKEHMDKLIDDSISNTLDSSSKKPKHVAHVGEITEDSHPTIYTDVETAWKWKNFHIHELRNTHDGVIDGNEMHGEIEDSSGKRCKAHKYRAKMEFQSDEYWYFVQMCYIAALLGGPSALFGIFLLKATEIATNYSLGTDVKNVEALKPTPEEMTRQRWSYRACFALLGAALAVYFSVYEETEYTENYLLKAKPNDVLVSTVETKGFRTDKHSKWIEQTKYNFLGLDCPNFQYDHFNETSGDPGWAYQATLLWAHHNFRYKFLYWADPGLIDVNALTNDFIPVSVMEDDDVIMTIDKKGGVLLRNQESVMRRVMHSKIMCQSPVEPPLVSLLALMYGHEQDHEDWYAAVDAVARHQQDVKQIWAE